ncbi:VanW family protein [Planococcus beijingensis]|uniref:VanW family protein n=1 Tax=Planococcus beijingensis TaxID=2782551 RepID=UPI00193B3D82
MDNKLFGLAFAAVFGIAVFVFGTANVGAYAVDNWLFPTEEFGDNTYIGTTDVSNMEVESAKMMFAGQSETWRSDAELHVTYQDATAAYPLENAEILLDETVRNAETGSQNNFVFKLPEATTAAFLAQHFPVADFTEPDLALINEKLETALQAGQTKTVVTISDDALGIAREKVSDIVFPASLSSKGSSIVIEALDGIQLAPSTRFSFLEFIAELPLSDISDSELTQIASAIYGALLQSNFSIDERSIGSQVPALIPAGQEAAINRGLGIDFVFTNPNASSFTLNMSKDSGSVDASLSGYPFLHTYTIGVTEETDIEPRLIKQYSAFVTSGNKVEEKGRAGKRLTVIRTVLDGNEEVEVETVSNDFYPPVHRVEVYPLTKPEAPAATVPIAGQPGFVDANGDGIHDGTTPVVPIAGQPGFVDANGDGIHDGAPATPTIPVAGQPGFVDTNGDGVHDGATPTTPVAGQPGFIDANGDGVHDVPTAPATPVQTEESKEPADKPVYDKGGNLVPK